MTRGGGADGCSLRRTNDKKGQQAMPGAANRIAALDLLWAHRLIYNNLRLVVSLYFRAFFLSGRQPSGYHTSLNPSFALDRRPGDVNRTRDTRIIVFLAGSAPRRTGLFSCLLRADATTPGRRGLAGDLPASSLLVRALLQGARSTLRTRFGGARLNRFRFATTWARCPLS